MSQLRQEVEPDNAAHPNSLGRRRDSAVELLRAHGLLSHAVLHEQEGAFPFRGDDQALSQLLSEMTATGLRLTGFHEVKQSVEELYLKLSHGQVM